MHQLLADLSHAFPEIERGLAHNDHHEKRTGSIAPASNDIRRIKSIVRLKIR